MFKYFFLLLICCSSFGLNYSVNLSWIYRELKPAEKFIFPAEHRGINLEKNLLGWIKKTPNNPIHVWYDSEFVTPEQIKASKDFLEKFNSERKIKNAVTIKDIRELEEVAFWNKENNKIFSSATPVYFRSDITRIIATIETVKKCTDACYYVYTDFDVTPMDEGEIFDTITLKKLSDFGIVFKEGGFSYNMENLFHIVSNKEDSLLKAMDDVLVQLNIKRAENALKNKGKSIVARDWVNLDDLKEIVYGSISFMFKYYYHLKGWAILDTKDGENPSYKVIIDKLGEFKHAYQGIEFNFKTLNKKIKNERGSMIIPTKPGIEAAPVSLDYY